jgi:uncharacterized protein (DUF433 family)
MAAAGKLQFRAMEAAFTTEQVMRITGVSRRRLTYWLERGVIGAETEVMRGRRHIRVWSFRNLVEVRVALWLRERVSLQLLGKIVIKLRSQGLETPLAEVRVAVLERRRRTTVVVMGADGQWLEPVTGQLVMELVLPLGKFEEELSSAIDNYRMERRIAGRIERQRGCLGSKPVFAGTRIPVDTVHRLRAAGWSSSRILAEYPALREADLLAAGESESASRAG